jgi:ABC-type phosphate transport system substrate-binding protein
MWIPTIYRGRQPFRAVAFFVGLLTAASGVQAGDGTLNENGSTRVYPLFEIWVQNYTSTHPGVKINVGATGSDAGIKKAISGEAQIGASDVFMSDRQARENPQILNIPLCISAQMVNYNLPGLNPDKLKLDGTVLAGIYSGKIREWVTQVPENRHIWAAMESAFDSIHFELYHAVNLRYSVSRNSPDARKAIRN